MYACVTYQAVSSDITLIAIRCTTSVLKSRLPMYPKYKIIFVKGDHYCLMLIRNVSYIKYLGVTPLFDYPGINSDHLICCTLDYNALRIFKLVHV